MIKEKKERRGKEQTKGKRIGKGWDKLDECLECGGRLVCMKVKTCVVCGEIFVNPKETDKIIKKKIEGDNENLV